MKVVLVVLLCVCLDAGAVEFVFMHYTGGAAQVFYHSGDVSRQLTDEPGGAMQPSISTNGDVAYMATRGGRTQVVAVALDDDEAWDVTHEGNNGWPGWAPDGQSLVVASDRDGQADLWIIEPWTGGARRLTNSTHWEWYAAFSPDGEWVAYTTEEYGGQDIEVIPVLGGDPIRLTDDGSWSGMPTWAPDGASLAYTRALQGPEEVWLIGIGGEGARHLASDAEHPSWGSEAVLFVSSRSGRSQIWSIAPGSGAITQLTHLPGSNYQADVRVGGGSLSALDPGSPLPVTWGAVKGQ